MHLSKLYMLLLPDLFVLLLLMQCSQFHLLSLLLLQHFHLQLLQELAVLIIEPCLLQLRVNEEWNHMREGENRVHLIHPAQRLVEAKHLKQKAEWLPKQKKYPA